MKQQDKRILLFDLGNILVHLNHVEPFWNGRIPLVDRTICQERWIKSSAVRDLETGNIDDFNTFYQLACSEMDIDLDMKQFEEIFISLIGEKFHQTDEILSRLYGRFPLMLLSDTSEPHWRHCRDTLALGQFFDKTYLSYEIGCMKPDRRIYEAVLADIGTIPQNIYYFDDKPDNVEMGQKMGMNAYVSWGGPTLLSQLEQHGFL